MPDRDRESLATLLAVQDGRPPVPLLDDEGIRDLLRSNPRIAVIGASSNPIRPALGVMRSLRRAGYDVVAVGPRDTEIDGLPCYPTLEDVVRTTGPVDLVDVFRRPEACADHAREAVAVGARCLWLQLGIADAEAGRIAHEAGLSVVMDRCTQIEVGRLAWG